MSLSLTLCSPLLLCPSPPSLLPSLLFSLHPLFSSPLQCFRVPTGTPNSKFPFVIQDGHTNAKAPDFLLFRQHYCLCDGALQDTLGRLERLLRRFAIPIALVSGERLVELVQSGALEFRGHGSIGSGGGGADGHGCWLSSLERCLLQTLENHQEVWELVGRPGRRYLGEGGREAAAVRVQACWRRHRARAAYLEWRRHQWAVATIAISWLMHAQLSRVRKALQARRLHSLQRCRQRAKVSAMATIDTLVCCAPHSYSSTSVEVSVVQFCRLNFPDINAELSKTLKTGMHQSC